MTQHTKTLDYSILSSVILVNSRLYLVGPGFKLKNKNMEEKKRSREQSGPSWPQARSNKKPTGLSLKLFIS